jgi:DNA polymerase elongation subunit (family B)
MLRPVDMRKKHGSVWIQNDDVSDSDGIINQKHRRFNNYSLPTIKNDGMYWLIDTNYMKDSNHQFVFIDISGKLFKYVVNTVSPFFFVKMPRNEVVKVLMINNVNSKIKSLVDITMKDVRGSEVKLTKVVVHTPSAVSGPKGISSLFESDSQLVYNNKVIYSNLVLNETKMMMGMPYIFSNGVFTQVVSKDSANDALYADVYQSIPKEAIGMGKILHEIIHAPLPPWHKLIACIDIEIQANFMDSMDPLYSQVPITSIAVTTYDSTRVFTIDNFILHQKNIENANANANPDNFILEIFKSEKDLLVASLNYISQMVQPFLVFYHGDGFDVPYIVHRIELFGLNNQFNIYWSEETFGFMKVRKIKWKNKIVLDLYEYFSNPSISNYVYGGYENNKLDTVARAVIKEGKYLYEGSIESLDSNELAYYNAKDAQLTFKLATHNDNFPVFILFFIMRFSDLSLYKANRSGVTTWWNGFLIRYLHQRNIHIPYSNKTKNNIIGADVITANPGIYRNISVLDFASLYPTNIIKYNLCFSTVNCGHSECPIIDLPTYPIKSCNHYVGIIPASLIFLRSARLKIYKPRSNPIHKEFSQSAVSISQFFKVVMNAVYGCMANEGFMFFNGDIAQAVTATSRRSLAHLIKTVQDEGGTVHYGDSVAGSSPVIIRIAETKEIMNIDVTGLWNQLIKRGHTALTHHETKERIDLSGKNLEIWDGDQFNPLLGFIRHLTSKSMFRVSTEHGMADVTGDHSLVTDDGHEISPILLMKNINNSSITLSSKVFPIVNYLSTTKGNYDNQILMLSIFSLCGTTSRNMTISRNIHFCSIQGHTRYLEHIIAILEYCRRLFYDWGISYTIYIKDGTRPRFDITFSSFNKLWDIVRREVYDEEGKKIKPYPGIFNLSYDAAKLYYNFIERYYFNDGRWVFPNHLHMASFRIFHNQFGAFKFVFNSYSRKKYFFAQTSGNSNLRKFTIGTYFRNFPGLDNYVYDFETKLGTFAVDGLKCHNTDSVFASNVSPDIVSIMSKDGMEVSNEGFWKAMFFYKKKNYILFSDHQIKIKGFLGIKKSTPLLIRKAFKECINGIPFEKSNKEIEEYIIKNKEKLILSILNCNNISLVSLQFTQILTKELCNCLSICHDQNHYKNNTPIVQAANNLQNHFKSIGKNIAIRKGIHVDYVKCYNGWIPSVLVNDINDIDLRHYVTIVGSVYQQLLDVSITTKQQSLINFFDGY